MGTIRKQRKIAVIDCETDPFQHNRFPQPFLWGYFDGTDYSEFSDTSKLITFLRSRNEIVYAHNGGKFDFHFLLDSIDTFRQIKIINNRLVSVPFGNCELRDSFSIIPTPLAEFDKMAFDYSKLEYKRRNKFMFDIRAYLKSDCVNLYKLVKAFVDRYGTQLTLASTAMNECQRILEVKGKDLTSSSSFYNEFYPWYYGGRVQCFKVGHFNNTTYIYDINSAYPYAMTKEHPIGTDYDVHSDCKCDIAGIDFYTIECESFGALPERGVHLNFPQHISKQRLFFFATGHEIQAGLDTDTIRNMVVKKHIHFSKTISFERFVDYYYLQKQTAKRHSTDYIFAKLMLNSLYGKFAANPNNYHDYLLLPAQFIKASEELDGYTYGGMLGNNNAIVYRNLPESKQRYYNISTAASITGYVRAMLWRAIAKLQSQSRQVYYCDTDSIITNGKLDTSGALGAWKLEQTNSQVIVIAPKLYGARDAHTGNWKIASKGIEIDIAGLRSLAKGNGYRYKRNAPTYSVAGEPRFITRIVSGLEYV